jgi:hypothetical protein
MCIQEDSSTQTTLIPSVPAPSSLIPTVPDAPLVPVLTSSEATLQPVIPPVITQNSESTIGTNSHMETDSSWILQEHESSPEKTKLEENQVSGKRTFFILICFVKFAYYRRS